MSEERGRRKVRQGVVVSAANDKTIVVSWLWSVATLVVE